MQRVTIAFFKLDMLDNPHYNLQAFKFRAGCQSCLYILGEKQCGAVESKNPRNNEAPFIDHDNEESLPRGLRRMSDFIVWETMYRKMSRCN